MFGQRLISALNHDRQCLGLHADYTTAIHYTVVLLVHQRDKAAHDNAFCGLSRKAVGLTFHVHQLQPALDSTAHKGRRHVIKRVGVQIVIATDIGQQINL